MMSTNPNPGICYQILIKEHLDGRWADWFEGLDITHTKQGATILTGLIADQSELQGILSTIGMLNMTLISVIQVDMNLCEEP